MAAIAQIEHINKTFGARKVIKDVSFEINPGEVFGFVGPNGAGKTTVIKMMTGLLRIDSGRITINGYDVVREHEKAMAGVGGIIENPEMYKHLSGMENLRQFARLHGNVSESYIKQVVSQVGLSERINDKVKKYSLGMRQRLGIAQAIINQPNLLVLDEPTNGLDPLGIKELRELLRELAHKSGIGIMVSSHMLPELQLMCDRVGFISDGEVLDFKTMDEIVAARDGALVYHFSVDDAEKAVALLSERLDPQLFEQAGVKKLGDKQEFTATITKEQSAQFTRALIEGEISIYSARAESGTLEDTFLDITTDKSGSKQIK